MSSSARSALRRVPALCFSARHPRGPGRPSTGGTLRVSPGRWTRNERNELLVWVHRPNTIQVWSRVFQRRSSRFEFRARCLNSDRSDAWSWASSCLRQKVVYSSRRSGVISPELPHCEPTPPFLGCPGLALASRGGKRSGLFRAESPAVADRELLRVPLRRKEDQGRAPARSEEGWSIGGDTGPRSCRASRTKACSSRRFATRTAT